MTTQENGSLGLTKKSILERLDTLIELNSKIYEASIDDKIAVVTEDASLKSGLTDAQVEWVKTKLAAAETLIDQATAQFIDIKSRLTSLETKAAQAVTKFASLDTDIAAIKARLTAHHI